MMNWPFLVVLVCLVPLLREFHRYPGDWLCLLLLLIAILEASWWLAAFAFAAGTIVNEYVRR